MTDHIDRAEVDDPRVVALAKARQQIAYESPFNFVCPPWGGLSEQEQHLSLLDARSYLYAAIRAGLTATPASAGVAPAADQDGFVCKCPPEICQCGHHAAPAVVPAVDETAEAAAKTVTRAIYALKSLPPPGSQHYRSGWDDGLEAAIDAARDAVLAVLPDTSRAAVLREAIDVAREEGHRLEEVAGVEAARGARSVAYLLRKLLVKAQPGLRRVAGGEQHTNTQTLPARGDQVEQWLKGQRDEYEVRSSPRWGALDEVLDTYRLHADTGTPLDQHACEGQHCDCPAASAAPAAPDTEAPSETVHGCPPDGSGLTPCCGRTPFELPLKDRISSEAPTTCTGAPR